MFVLLEHTAEGSPHWDLLVELPGAEKLPTWRLERSPLDTNEAIPATRIQDHRRLYLDYEGEISGGRGVVRRLDRGAATIDCTADRVILVLAGDRLRGRFEITPGKDDREGEAPAEPARQEPRPPAGPLVFRPADP